MGRHPIQNSHIIRPDIGKIPKILVEKIPLVMYIPPPPEGSDFKSTSSNIISNPYTYPPGGTAKSVSKPMGRFKFLRPRSKKKDMMPTTIKLPADVEKTPGKGQLLTWSDYWEESEYPFVVLEGNRAACAICLTDFEEPKRRSGLEHPLSVDKETAPESSPAEKSPESDQRVQDESKPEKISTGHAMRSADASNSSITSEARAVDPGGHQPQDAVEEAQPLRLLICGHVFHVRNLFSFDLFVVLNHRSCRKRAWTHG